jgi:hypothetical protein
VSRSTGEDGFSYASHFLTSAKYFSSLLYLEVLIHILAANVLPFALFAFRFFCDFVGDVVSCVLAQ